jgi:hypothetical protein
VDWSLTYATIGERARRASQRAFLRLLAKGLAYQADAPTLWEVDFHTAVAQAELEDREVEGMSYRLRSRARSGRGRGGGDHPAGAAGRLRGPGRPPRRRPLRRHAGPDRAHPAVRGRGPGAGPQAGRARQGTASPCSAPSATRPTWSGGGS